MTEVILTLDLACCDCRDCFQATVQCSGKGLEALPASTPETKTVVAAVRLSCPYCGQVNQVLFEPTGRVRSIHPWLHNRKMPEPSLN